MTNGSGHQKKPPIHLDFVSFDRGENGRDIVLLELKRSDRSASDYFSIPQTEFVSLAREFLQRIQPDFQTQLIDVLQNFPSSKDIQDVATAIQKMSQKEE